MKNLSKAILSTAILEIALLLCLFFIKLTGRLYSLFGQVRIAGEVIMVILIGLIGLLVVRSMKSNFKIDN
jgi:Kef-type K+ transport system membrane component KefB